jgi:hypothetical protein
MRIAVIGAGSQFTLALLRALCQTARHDDYHVCLIDVRPEPVGCGNWDQPRTPKKISNDKGYGSLCRAVGNRAK